MNMEKVLDNLIIIKLESSRCPKLIVKSTIINYAFRAGVFQQKAI